MKSSWVGRVGVLAANESFGAGQRPARARGWRPARRSMTGDPSRRYRRRGRPGEQKRHDGKEEEGEAKTAIVAFPSSVRSGAS